VSTKRIILRVSDMKSVWCAIAAEKRTPCSSSRRDAAAGEQDLVARRQILGLIDPGKVVVPSAASGLLPLVGGHEARLDSPPRQRMARR